MDNSSCVHMSFFLPAFANDLYCRGPESGHLGVKWEIAVVCVVGMFLANSTSVFSSLPSCAVVVITATVATTIFAVRRKRRREREQIERRNRRRQSGSKSRSRSRSTRRKAPESEDLEKQQTRDEEDDDEETLASPSVPTAQLPKVCFCDQFILQLIDH